MENSGLRVIEGGKGFSSIKKYKFRSGIVTNTRLMGVMVLQVIWDVEGGEKGEKHFHQLFYLDAEEYGIDTYEGYYVGEPGDEHFDEIIDHIALRCGDMTSCLGGKGVEINENEARALIYYYYELTKRNGMDLPENIEEISFIVGTQTVLSENELAKLYKKVCVPIKNDNELINYFIMRIVAKDFLPAKYLSSSQMEFNIYPEFTQSALLKNKIIKRDGENVDRMVMQGDGESFKTKNIYITESLIDDGNLMYLLVSEIEVIDHKVVSFKRNTVKDLTPFEAALILYRNEFVDYFILDEMPEDLSSPLLLRSQRIEHENGTCYMCYREDNKHVRKSEYSISDDTIGFYFVSKSRELFIVSETEEGIKLMEQDFIDMGYYFGAKPMGKFKFSEPCVYEYADSYITNFLEYLDKISQK